jgi:hypothetical protein
MRLLLPGYFPGEFEIPDEWLSEAGMSGFAPPASAYCSTPTATLVPLASIEPPGRLNTCPKDWRGFDRRRLIRLLKGFVAGDMIEPATVVRRLEQVEFPAVPYRFRIHEGFHRFYGSIAAGFENLPAVI